MFCGCNLVAKNFRKIKLRRMSGILPQYLDSKARYRDNIKYRDLRWSRPGKRYYGLQTLEFKGLAGFLYFSDTKMMTSPRRFVGCKMGNFISVIFVF